MLALPKLRRSISEGERRQGENLKRNNMSWKNPEKWQKIISGENCPMCKDIHLDENNFSFKIKELDYTFVRLPKNQHLKGTVDVFFKNHAV